MVCGRKVGQRLVVRLTHTNTRQPNNNYYGQISILRYALVVHKVVLPYEKNVMEVRSGGTLRARGVLFLAIHCAV